MDTALPQKFPFILDRNLAKANCTGNRVCTSLSLVVNKAYILIVIPQKCINAYTIASPTVFIIFTDKRKELFSSVKLGNMI